MKRKKLVTALGIIVLAVSAISFTAFAASAYETPAQAVAGLTGRTEASVIAERTETKVSYGTIANEAGKLEEFKDEMQEIRKDALAERVTAGTLTQEQADEILAAMEANQAACDGTGSARIGQKAGAGLGKMNGQGQGSGMGRGTGMGRGAGNGSGVCAVQ